MPALCAFPFPSHRAASLLEGSQEVYKCGRGLGWHTHINSYNVSAKNLGGMRDSVVGFKERERRPLTGGKGLTEEVEFVLCLAISRTCTGKGREGCARQRGWGEQRSRDRKTGATCGE